MTATQLADRHDAVATELRALPTTTDAPRTLQGLSSAIDAAKVGLVAEVGEHEDHETEECSSIKNSLRDQLRLDTKTFDHLVRPAHTLTAMHALSDLAPAGAVSLDHVEAFTYAARHIDPVIAERSMDWMLYLATTPRTQIRRTARKLRATTHPDDLDQAWIKATDKNDITLNPVDDGYSVLATPFARRLHPHQIPPHRHRSHGPHSPAVAVRTHLRRARPTHQRPPGGRAPPPPDIDGRQRTPRTRAPHPHRPGRRRGRRPTRQTMRRTQVPWPLVHLHHIQHWSHDDRTDTHDLIGLCPRCHTAVHQGSVTIAPTTRRTHTGDTRAS